MDLEAQDLVTQLRKNDTPPFVSICCITFNHAPYIRKCLDGFLMQKTNFKYEILIHDDCSSDGTEKIIREYEALFPDLIKPIYQMENQFSKGIAINPTYNYPRARGKFIAFCEGDDYWTDPLKLQKQVDFIKNNDCDLVYSRVKQYRECDSLFLNELFGGPFENFCDLLRFNTIPTLTVLLKKSVLLEYLRDVEPEKHKWAMGDYPLWLYISLREKIRFLPETVGVYRVLQESLSHFTDYQKEKNWISSNFKMKKYFIQRYGDRNKLAKLENEKCRALLALDIHYNKKGADKYFKKINEKDFKTYILYLIYKIPSLSHLYKFKYKIF